MQEEARPRALRKRKAQQEDRPTWPCSGLDRASFIALVRERGIELYRDLPWRHIDDAYAVLVSEVMLQQTQVKRVERFWRRFLEAFPTIDALAAASTSDVLELWQGLGYNRRALALKKTADVCSAEFGGKLPRGYDDLVALPGIGPATAAGVRAFAFEEPGVYLETNVRAVFLHDVFPDCDKVSDRELAPLVADVCPAAPTGSGSADVARASAAERDPLASPRDWYYALLDYGAHLKATGVNPTRRSAHYTRQSAFEGSRRQKRSWIVRRVLVEPDGVKVSQVLVELNRAEEKAGRSAVDDSEFRSIIVDLAGEGFFRMEGDVLVP